MRIVNRTTRNKHQVVYHLVILLLCIAILFCSLLLQIEEGELYLFGLKWPHRCLLYEITGIKCALCGLTRSFCSLVHGDWQQSLMFHLLGPIIFAFTCFQIPYRIYGVIIHPRAINRRLIRINLSLTVTVTIVIFINWLIYLGGLIL